MYAEIERISKYHYVVHLMTGHRLKSPNPPFRFTERGAKRLAQRLIRREKKRLLTIKKYEVYDE